MGTFLIARFTIQEAIHRWLLFAMLVLDILLLGVFWLLLNSAYTVVAKNALDDSNPQLVLLRFGISITILSVWAAYLMSGALTIVLTVGAISSEVEGGTLSAIVSKPLRRAEIIAGKWLGYGLIVCVYTAILFFTFLAIIYWQTGYWPDHVWQTLGLIELSMLVLLALTTLGSTFLPTLVNGAVVIMLFMGAPMASFVQLITPAPSTTMQNITTTINLIIPTDALWHGASYYLIPSFIVSALGQQTLQQFN
jgi:Cu-processing system permease protein